MSKMNWIFEKGSLRSRKKAVLHLLWIFIVSRIAYFLMGVRFNDNWILEDCMSLIPYDLLRTDLLSSIWHFHVQPPLFSLLCGIIVKLFGLSHTVPFHVVYLFAGLSLLVGLYTLMVLLGVPYRIAAGLAILFIVSPDTILYENIILYPYLISTLLVISSLTLYKYINTSKWQWGAAFFILLSTIILTRSMFHLIWFIATLMIIIIISPKIWKRTLIISVIPFLLAFGLYARNYVQFGQFVSSTWMGMNVSRLAFSGIDDEEKIALAREGKVSELIFMRPFPGFWQLSGKVDLPAASPTGVTVLDTKNEKYSLANYNNIVFLSISKQFQKDSMAVIRNYKNLYFFKSLRSSFTIFFAPSNSWFNLSNNANFSSIQQITHIWNAVFYGDFAKDPSNTGWFILAVYAAVIGYWLKRLVRSFPINNKNAPFFTVVLFILMTVTYITLIGNLFELGENMRFHFQIDPLVLTLFALMIVGLKRKSDSPNN